MTLPSDKAIALLRYIQNYIIEHGRSPSYRTCAEHFGTGPGNIHARIEVLTSAGYLRKGKSGRGLTVLKPLDDDRFKTAATKAFKAVGHPVSEPDIAKAANAIASVLIKP